MQLTTSMFHLKMEACLITDIAKFIAYRENLYFGNGTYGSGIVCIGCRIEKKIAKELPGDLGIVVVGDAAGVSCFVSRGCGLGVLLRLDPDSEPMLKVF